MTARTFTTHTNFQDDHARLLALREFERPADVEALVTRGWVETRPSRWVSGGVRVLLTAAGEALVRKGRG